MNWLRKFKIAGLFVACVLIIIDIATIHGGRMTTASWIIFAVAGGLVLWAFSG